MHGESLHASVKACMQSEANGWKLIAAYIYLKIHLNGDRFWDHFWLPKLVPGPILAAKFGSGGPGLAICYPCTQNGHLLLRLHSATLSV